MAPNRSPVASVTPRSGSKTPASSAPLVSSATSALSSQPVVQRTEDTLYQVQKPAPPIDPSPPASTLPPTGLTPGLTNNSTHVRNGVDVVARRIDVAAEGVQGMTSFACGLLGVWPVVKLLKFFGGKGAERGEESPRIQAKQLETHAEDDLDGFSNHQEEDAMGNKAPPPYHHSWTQDLDDKGVR
ncbi:hypothetical protein FS837_005572 [Tulasnella sp. UAMH 9824]|nr:hypothetical protein FS837_005572 [Tulasnella sp. UAMH 9824]